MKIEYQISNFISKLRKKVRAVDGRVATPHNRMLHCHLLCHDYQNQN